MVLGIGQRGGRVWLLLARNGTEMTERCQIADELWAAFKHWEGERKYALRQIIKHIKKAPGDEAEGSCATRAEK